MSSNVFKCCWGYTAGVIVSIFLFFVMKHRCVCMWYILVYSPKSEHELKSGIKIPISLSILRNIISVLYTCQINSEHFPVCLLVVPIRSKGFSLANQSVGTAHTWYISDGRHDNACAAIQIAPACSYNSFSKISRGPV